VDPIFRVDGRWMWLASAALVHHDRRRYESFLVREQKEAPHGSGMHDIILDTDMSTNASFCESGIIMLR
jgi:hypothetical protein